MDVGHPCAGVTGHQTNDNGHGKQGMMDIAAGQRTRRVLSHTGSVTVTPRERERERERFGLGWIARDTFKGELWEIYIYIY